MSKFILSAFADEIDHNLDTQMDVLEDHSIEYIEMRVVDGKQLVHYSLEEVKNIKERIDARGFKVSAIGSPIGKISIVDDFGPHLELFKHTLEIAKIMECEYIRMFSFYIPKEESPEKYRDEVMNRLRSFIHIAEESGVILLHENEKGIYGDTPERCLDIFKTLNSEYLKGIFDFANFIQTKAKTYPDGFELLRDYIIYIHVKDAKQSTGKVQPAGEGDGNITEILTELHQVGYEGFLSLEPHLNKSYTDFSLLEPDSPGYDLPAGSAKRFAVAVQALKNILVNIK